MVAKILPCGTTDGKINRTLVNVEMIVNNSIALWWQRLVIDFFLWHDNIIILILYKTKNVTADIEWILLFPIHCGLVLSSQIAPTKEKQTQAKMPRPSVNF